MVLPAMSREAVAQRRALEALRSGVPNADVVRELGSYQAAAEAAFAQRLSELPTAIDADGQVEGLLISGDFGTGKSHLLEFLERMALERNFVTSRVVISKETPLSDPAKLFMAAISNARLPGHSGAAVAELALELKQNTPSYAALYRWANDPESGMAAMFPATLLLHERLSGDPELIEEVHNYWAGQKLPVARVREGLRQIGAAAAFSLKTPRARELNRQRWSFMARLIVGAGYGGWVLFLDEVELIGRYTLLQRAKSYAELARWMGIVEGMENPPLVAVASITDDFVPAVLDYHNDPDVIGPKLRDKGSDEYIALASRAEAGMRFLKRDALRLERPTVETLASTYDRLRLIHGGAYGWAPPDLSWDHVVPAKWSMRSYVRRWMNEWDLNRLYPGIDVQTEEVDLRPSYEEDVNLESAEQADGSDVEE